MTPEQTETTTSSEERVLSRLTSDRDWNTSRNKEEAIETLKCLSFTVIFGAIFAFILAAVLCSIASVFVWVFTDEVYFNTRLFIGISIINYFPMMIQARKEYYYL